jgi:hypothetical protein
MKNNLMLFIFALSFFIMGFKMFENVKEYVPEEEQVVNTLIDRSAEFFKQKFKLKPIGTLVSMPNCVVKKLGIHFQIYESIERDKIRKILVEIADEFVTMINKDIAIRPLLEVYPFTVKNVDIALFIQDKNGIDVWAPHIGMASIRKGSLKYIVLEEVDDIPVIREQFVESYEDALKILNSNNS